VSAEAPGEALALPGPAIGLAPECLVLRVIVAYYYAVVFPTERETDGEGDPNRVIEGRERRKTDRQTDRVIHIYLRVICSL
jgi:hypothetical protein